MSANRHLPDFQDAPAGGTEAVGEPLFRALVEQSLAGIYIIQSGSFLYCNPVFAEIFGYESPAELVERVSVAELVAPEDRERVAENIRKRQEGLVKDMRYSFVGVRKDDGRIEVEVHGRSIVHEGRPAVIGVILDVTDRKQAEQKILHLNEELEERVKQRTAALLSANEDLRNVMQRLAQTEKLATVGRLAAGLAHQINTPLGNIIMTASSLQDSMRDLAERLRTDPFLGSALGDFVSHCDEGLAIVTRNSQKVAVFIAKLKEASLDRGCGKRCVFDLQELLTDWVRLLEFDRQAFTMRLDIPAGVRLESDPAALEQTLTIMVINSLQHGFAGRKQGLINIGAEIVGQYLVLKYSDDGIGMSETIVTHAFDPFYTTQFGKGDGGLGLYSAYGLVTVLLGGGIELHSEPGKGVHFSIMIPIVVPSADVANR